MTTQLNHVTIVGLQIVVILSLSWTVAGVITSITPYTSTLTALPVPSGNLAEMFYDSQGRLVFSDRSNTKVARLELDGTTITDLATGYTTFSVTEGPDEAIYFPALTNKIIQVTSAGVVSDFAGSGVAARADATGIAAEFNSPRGIIYFALHQALYVAEDGAVRKIVIATQVVTTIASNATYLQSSFFLTINRNGTHIFVGFLYVTRIIVATGEVQMLAVTKDGLMFGDPFLETQGYSLSLNETLLMVADSGNRRIMNLNLINGDVGYGAGGQASGSQNGPAATSTFRSFAGFRQHCLPNGDCGVYFSNCNGDPSLRFFGFETNSTTPSSTATTSTSKTPVIVGATIGAVVAVVLVVAAVAVVVKKGCNDKSEPAKKPLA